MLSINTDLLSITTDLLYRNIFNIDQADERLFESIKYSDHVMQKLLPEHNSIDREFVTSA